LSSVQGQLGQSPDPDPPTAGETGADHDGEHHEHEENLVELSPQAQKSIGLKLERVQLTTFTRTVTVPGIVTERPGRSLFEVTAPLTGVISKIFVLEGAAVEPNQQLFEIRLTHEEVVQAQSDMLRTVEELAVNELEIERLRQVTATGLAGKTLLEREYEQRKLQAVLRAQRQTLLLHGFSQEQVDRIEKKKSLLSSFTVFAPQVPLQDDERAKNSLQLETLKVT
jgi:multidrug efflux pump subunit AcrA (membrane-fusion protein)